MASGVQPSTLMAKTVETKEVEEPSPKTTTRKRATTSKTV